MSIPHDDGSDCWRPFRAFAPSTAPIRGDRTGCNRARRLFDDAGIADKLSRSPSANIASLTETIKNNPDSAASGLIPQQAEPLLGRALSYLALGQAKEAAADLDEAVQDDPNNAQAWIARGLAYEQLGDKTRAAGCYGRAITLRPKDDAARSAFARVGGKSGQSYETF